MFLYYRYHGYQFEAENPYLEMPSTYELAMENAAEALRTGALASAILWYEVAVQTDLERPDGWEMLGLCRYVLLGPSQHAPPSSLPLHCCTGTFSLVPPWGKSLYFSRLFTQLGLLLQAALGDTFFLLFQSIT